MPTHVYQPLSNPPNWRDRLLVHPMDTTVAFLAVFFGALVALSLFLPEFAPSESMDKMPWPITVLVGGFLGSGGLMGLLGLNWWGDEVSHGWAIERFGWLLSTGGFATYSLTVSWHYPESIFSWGIPLILAVACILRFWSIVFIEKATRQNVAEVRGGINDA